MGEEISDYDFSSLDLFSEPEEPNTNTDTGGGDNSTPDGGE